MREWRQTLRKTRALLQSFVRMVNIAVQGQGIGTPTSGGGGASIEKSIILEYGLSSSAVLQLLP